MKSLTLILMFFTTVLLAGNSSVNWFDTQTVTSGTDFYNNRPRIVLTSNNIPIIIWGKQSTGQLYISRLDGTDFSLPLQLNPLSTEAFISDWAGPEISAKGDTVFVVYKLKPEDIWPVFVMRSIDGGETFGDTVRVHNFTDHESRFPSVSIGNNGNPIIAFMKFLPGWLEPEYSVSRSLDGGQSFLPDTSGTYLAPGEVCDCCPASIISSGNDHILSFRNNDQNLRDAWLAVSSDDGISFSTAGDIDDNGWIIFSCPSSGPESMVNGNDIITTWMSGATGAPRVYVGQSDFSTTPLGSNIMIHENVPSNVSQNFPKIAGKGDTIGIVWHETFQGNSYIFFKHSTSGINGFIITDTIAASPNNSLKNPEVSYNNGYFHIIYQDDRDRKVIYRIGQIKDNTTTGIYPNGPIEINITPNPFHDRTNISRKGKVGFPLAISIYDLKGIQYREWIMYTDEMVIEKGSLNKGIYILKIEGEGHITNQKLLIR